MSWLFCCGGVGEYVLPGVGFATISIRMSSSSSSEVCCMPGLDVTFVLVRQKGALFSLFLLFAFVRGIDLLWWLYLSGGLSLEDGFDGFDAILD